MLSKEKDSPEHENLLNQVIKKAKIYARMSPDNKAMLVSQLQEKTTDIVGM